MNEEIKWPEITKDTPMPELKRIHQMIWDYTIEHGEKPETPYFYNCMACEYCTMHVDFCQRFCFKCPIVWPKNDDGIRLCTSKNGLYYRWFYAEGEEMTALAKQIRDLPWKYELEEDVSCKEGEE